MKELLKLYTTFFRVGLFTFGGGYAMLPMLKREVVEKQGWADENELMDYYAVGQCTPGVIAVNVATFVGSRRKGVPGGVFATLGVISPSIVILSVIAAFLGHFAENPYVAHALAGIRLAVCAMVTVSIAKLYRKSVVDALTAVIAVCVFLAVKLLGLTPALAVVLSALVGIAFRCLVRKKDGERK